MMIVHNRTANHCILILKITLLILAILVGAGCTHEPQMPLRIGTNVWPGYEPLYLARELGYYPQESVRLVEYSSASEAIRAFRNRAIDAAALTLDEVLLLAETTSDLSVVLVLDISNGGDVILAQPTLSGLRDLKGKQVGLEASALGAYVLTRALQTVNLTPNDVRPVSLEVSEHERAFKDRRVDAVVTFEPVRTKLLKAGARQLFDSSRIPGEIVDVLVVRRTFLEQHRAQINQLVRSWFKSLDFIQKERSRAASLMAPRERITADDFQKALLGLHIPDIAENRSMLTGPAPTLIPPAQQLGRVMLANRLIERSPELKGLFDGSFVKDATP
jgi:NitT/TauT family transport system substrate-binding protein